MSQSLLEWDDEWDLDALHQIAGWRNFRALSLSSIPIKKGQFLIEIGRQCTHMEKLELRNMSIRNSCDYTNELLQMIMCFRNPKEFTLHEKIAAEVSDVFFWLNKNPELKKIDIKLEKPPSNTISQMISSIEYLLYSCSKLTTFICIFNHSGFDVQSYNDKLMYILQRSKVIFNRPNLQFQVRDGEDTNNIVYEDFSPLQFPNKLH